MRKVAGAITKAVSIPLVHLADATAKGVEARRIKKVGLLASVPLFDTTRIHP